MRFLCFEIRYIGFFLRRKIQKLLKEHRKIAAIKLYRNHKKTGLKHSKEHVDKIEHQMFLRGELENSFINQCKNADTQNCY